MIKHFLLASTAIGFLAGAAQAEVEFVKGTASIGTTPYYGGGIYGINTDTSAAFVYGNWGFQVGGQITAFTDFTSSIVFGSTDLHFYRNLQNGNKIGAYVGTLSFFGPPALDSGVEGMFSFGAVDIETSVGVISGSFGPTNTGTFDLMGYYELNDRFEVNAGVASIFNLSGPGSAFAYTAGASYAFGNNGMEAFLGYTYIDGGPSGAVNVGLTWNFGPDQDERLFSHGSNFFSNLLIP